MTCYNVVTYTAKLFNHTISNKGSQVIDSPQLLRAKGTEK